MRYTLYVQDVGRSPQRFVEVQTTEPDLQQQEPPALQRPAQLAPRSLSLLQVPFVDSVTGETMSPINSSSTRLAWPATAGTATAARSGSVCAATAAVAPIQPVAAKALNRTY
jgi:hypothetical protein